jgi:hemerythrin
MYKSCNFDRKEYLRHKKIFENNNCDDAQEERDEFNDEIDSLAIELAYTRYALSKAEKMLESALPLLECTKQEHNQLITAIGEYLSG